MVFIDFTKTIITPNYLLRIYIIQNIKFLVFNFQGFCGHIYLPSSSALLNDKLFHFLHTSADCNKLSHYKINSMIDCKQHFSNDSTNKPTDSIDKFREREEEREKNDSESTEQKEKTTKEQEQDEDESLNEIRSQILDAALPYVVAHGWSRTAISRGAEQIGYPSVVHGMFGKDAGNQLIQHFYKKCNQQIVDIMKSETQNGTTPVKNPTEFLIRFVKTRLRMLEPYLASWPSAIATMALPHNVPTSLAQLLTLVDDICYYSGDRSVDFGWYTRRVGLATIYKMTELYMIQDSSTDHQKTWNFLENRMNEAKYLEEFLGYNGKPSINLQDKLKSTFETARNMTGLGFDRH